MLHGEAAFDLCELAASEVSAQIIALIAHVGKSITKAPLRWVFLFVFQVKEKLRKVCGRTSAPKTAWTQACLVVESLVRISRLEDRNHANT